MKRTMKFGQILVVLIRRKGEETQIADVENGRGDITMLRQESHGGRTVRTT